MAIQLKGNDESTYSNDITIGPNTLASGPCIRTVGTLGVLQIRTDNDSFESIQIYNDGNANSNKTVTVKSDGSATFAGGDVNIAANAGLRLGKPGNDNNASIEIVCGINPAASQYTAFQILNSTNSQTVSFKADGRATFGPYDSGTGNLIYGDGGFVARRTDDTQRLFVGLDNATETFVVNRDGSATFLGKVLFDVRNYGSAIPAIQARANTLNDSDAPVTSYNGNTNGGYVYTGYGPNNTRCFAIQNSGSAYTTGLTIGLDADNPANFNDQGTYTGPTLDVKDTIRTVQSALYRLKAAVLIPDQTVNDLRLKILEALENISEVDE